MDFADHVVEAFKEIMELIDRICADSGAVVPSLHLIELLIQQIHIPEKIPVEHENDNKADDQNDQNAHEENLLLQVKRIH
ncbi:hypothetical protein D3C73_1494120 [compost metagenome]